MKNLERKKKEEKNKLENAHLQSHKQFVVANLYTKFEVSILNLCGDIFDEKSGQKVKRTNIGKNK